MSRRFNKQYAGQGVLSDSTLGIFLDWGPTPPTDGTPGYGVGCIWIDTDAADGAQWLRNDGTVTSCDFNQILGGVDLATLTSTVAELNILTGVTATAAELNYIDQSLATNTLTRGAGVDTAESYAAGIFRAGGLIVTRIVLDLSTLIGSATDLDIIGESAAASCHWGQITTAKSGTLIAGKVECLELPAGGGTDIDFYSSTVSTGTQDVIITDAALGTETALVTSGGAWASGTVKGMTGLPTANDFLYIVNGAAAGGTYTGGKFLIEFYGS